MLNRAISDRTVFENKEIKIEEDKLQLEKEKEMKAEYLCGEQNKIESRKLDLEERRLLLKEKMDEAENEEKRASILERKEMAAAFCYHGHTTVQRS